MASTIICTWWIVEWAEWKPNWESGRTEFEILGKMYLRIILSRIFAKKGRRLIGRKKDAVSGGFLSKKKYIFGCADTRWDSNVVRWNEISGYVFRCAVVNSVPSKSVFVVILGRIIIFRRLKQCTRMKKKYINTLCKSIILLTKLQYCWTQWH